MKVKIEKVIIGNYGYDSIITNINNKRIEIIFEKKDNISQYDGKDVDLVNENGIYKIKPITNSTNKKNDKLD